LSGSFRLYGILQLTVEPADIKQEVTLSFIFVSTENSLKEQTIRFCSDNGGTGINKDSIVSVPTLGIFTPYVTELIA